ncbi:MAG: phospholipid/cholesterol/gamma-HCH transport system substrate-binding protein, partial [Solirubrobacteraceae bacterium]|nr:phospholipid/cholesterol/gamma-HCH transport system substrate-binding protein [Solirubrobacteraceae bacterium]
MLDVAIVGFGPVGQALAVLLGQAGHRVAAFERFHEAYRMPRAVHIDHEVMRILQSAGVAERVLDDMLPLLQSLKPAELSLALNALSSSLRGRGNRLGGNFVRVDAYFKQFNPELPALQEDFKGLADVSQSYAAAAPDLLRLVDNAAAVSRNLVDQKQELATFLSSTSTFSDTFTRFLDANQDRLITLASASRPALGVYARYAPEYPCMFKGLTTWQPRVQNSFGGLQPGLHITL